MAEKLSLTLTEYHRFRSGVPTKNADGTSTSNSSKRLDTQPVMTIWLRLQKERRRNSKRQCGACHLISSLPSSPAAKLHLNWRRSVTLPNALRGNSRDRIQTQVLLPHSAALGKVCLLINLTPGLKNARKTKTHATCRVREMVQQSRTQD